MSTTPDHLSAVGPSRPSDASATPRAPGPRAGARFRPLRFHARGGLGEVLLAEDAELRRSVALKRIRDQHADDLAARARFQVEAEITGRLEHPGIVPVYGMGADADGRPYYAMRFISGRSLKAEIDRFHAPDPAARMPRPSATDGADTDGSTPEFPAADGGTAPSGPSTGASGTGANAAIKQPRVAGDFRSLEFRRLLQRFVSVCQTVEYAHSRGVIHRDLKPANVMLGPYGETLVVDWGLAKALAQSRGDRASASGVRGTLPREAPPDTGSGVVAPPPPPSETGSTVVTWGPMPPRPQVVRTDEDGTPFAVPAPDSPLPGAVRFPADGSQPGTPATRAAQHPPPQPDPPADLAGPGASVIAPAGGSGSETRTGMMLGTLGYMAPEQASGESDLVGPPADVYALGASLYHLLTGMRPLSGLPETAVLLSTIAGKVPGTRTIRADVPAALDAICRKAMAVRPGDRHRSAASLASDLERFLADEPVSCHVEPFPARVARTLRKHPVAVSVTVAAAVLTAGFLAVLASVQDGRNRELEKHNSELEAARTAADTARRDALAQAEIARRQSRAAREGLAVARQAVDRYYVQVAEGPLLRAPGQQELQAELLGAAADYYERLKDENPDDPEGRRLVATASRRAGHIAARLGRHEQAERNFRRGVEVADAMVAQRPDDPAPAAEAAAQRSGLVRLLLEAGKGREADEAAAAALASVRAAAARFPDDPAVAGELAMALTSQSRCRERAGDVAATEALLGEAVAIRRRLAARTDLPDARSDLADTLLHRSSVLSRVARRREAEAELAESIRIREELLAKAPEDRLLKSGLGASLITLSVLQAETGRRDSAVTVLERAGRVYLELARDNPRVADYWIQLSTCFTNAAAIRRSHGDLVSAEAYYRQALETLTHLSEGPRATPEGRARVASARKALGSVLSAAGKIPEARRELDAAVEAWRKLVADLPDVASHRSDLGQALNSRAILAKRTERDADAEADLREALSLHEAVRAAAPQVTNHAVDVAGACCNMGHHLAERGRHDEALALYARAEEVLEAAGRKDPASVNIKEFRRRTAWGRAELLRRQRKHLEAADSFRQAASYLDDPLSVRLWLMSAEALLDGGDHARAGAMLESRTDIPTAPELHAAGCMLARAVVAVEKDESLPAERRAARSAELLAAVVARFEAARKAGKTDWTKLPRDPDVAPILDRPAMAEFLRRVGQ